MKHPHKTKEPLPMCVDLRAEYDQHFKWCAAREGSEGRTRPGSLASLQGQSAWPVWRSPSAGRPSPPANAGSDLYRLMIDRLTDLLDFVPIVRARAVAHGGLQFVVHW